MAPSSLYSAIKLACLVQRAKDRLKSCIERYLPQTKPDKSPYSPKLQTHACKTISSAIKVRSRSTSFIRRIRCVLAQKWRSDIPSLFDELDLHVQPGALPLRVISANDYLFIGHDFHLASLTSSIDKLYDIHALTTALLGRLQNYSGSNIQQIYDGANDGLLYDDLEGGKFMANLEHLLRCLKQIALDAILRTYLTIVEAHILRWHHYWQYQKRIDEGWFAEWPNGQRPLSTTWPWNVKPSLLVLWGVCWMFYGSSGYNTRTSRNRRTTGPISEDIRTGQTAEHHQPQLSEQQHLSAAYGFPTHTDQVATTNSSQAWAVSAPNLYPNFSWPHPHQASSHARRANNPSRNSFSGYGPGSSYITGTANVSSDLFPAASAGYWSYCQGINQDPSPAYAPSYPPWQSAYNTGENLVTTSQRTRSDPNVQSYGPPPQVANPQATAGSLSSLGFGLGLPMQNYPSPHSDVSHQTTSPCLSVVPGAMMSPSMPLVASPSVAGSSNSRQSSRRSQEPPRNTEGLMYCDNRECAEQPPVFARKCEWTKHMDKHNRPYVCEERGCENIKGFTYSGGLSRHQREVHRQHGGPKASCHCPHKDCKRSTGVGFSRKENLYEHLRRVHRDVAADHVEEPNTPSNEVSFVSGTRKRRRAAPAEEQDDENDLEQEVKKLRKELQEKDKRLERLEQVVARLQSSQQK